VIGRAGPNDDPVRIVAWLLGELERAGKRGSRFERDCVAAGRMVERILQVIAVLHGNDLAWRRRIGQRSFHIDAGQFGRTIKLT
jgi:hypothetical protein